MAEVDLEIDGCEESRCSTPDKVAIGEMSDTFRRVLGQLNINNDNPLCSENLDCLDGVSRMKHRGSLSDEEPETMSVSPPTPPRGRRASVCVGQLQSVNTPASRRTHRRKSVQWIDERLILPIAHEPTPEEKHGARIFIKTIPKSILKNSHENIAIDHSKV